MDDDTSSIRMNEKVNCDICVDRFKQRSHLLEFTSRMAFKSPPSEGAWVPKGIVVLLIVVRQKCFFTKETMDKLSVTFHD